MKLFDFAKNHFEETDIFPEDWCEKDIFFALCDAGELLTMKDVLYFDETTVKECENLDERVRYSCFNGYDFISLVYPDRTENGLEYVEINLYISKQYVVLVLPNVKKKNLDAFCEGILQVVAEARNREDALTKVYYSVFNIMLTDFSDLLEEIEDELQELQSKILSGIDKKLFEKIDHFGQIAYTTRKQLRALSFLGAQILMDENELISDSHTHYFRNIDTRFKKLSGFADGLYEHVNQLISSHDSRLSMRTNEIVTKLTVLTLFFGPLTVITGIYGMNFDFMPTLHIRYGYYFTLAGMGAVTALLYGLLKYKKWM